MEEKNLHKMVEEHLKKHPELANELVSRGMVSSQNTDEIVDYLLKAIDAMPSGWYSDVW